MEGFLETRTASLFSFYSKKRWSKVKRNFLEFPPIGHEEVEEKGALNLKNIEAVTHADTRDSTEFLVEWKTGPATYFRAVSYQEKDAWLQFLENFVDSAGFTPPAATATLSSSTTRTSPPRTPSRIRSTHRFFGIPLSYGKGILSCITFLTKHGAADAEGIFRLPGRPSECRELLASFLIHSEFDIPSSHSIHAVATVLKTLISSLPETPLSNALYNDFLHAADKKDVTDITRLLLALPTQYRLILYELLVLGRAICESKSSRMNPTSLGLVLGPSLLTTDEPDLLLQLKKTMVPLFIEFMDHFDELLSETHLKELETEKKSLMSTSTDRKHDGSRKFNPEDKTPLLTPGATSKSQTTTSAASIPPSSSQSNSPRPSVACYCLCCCFTCCPRYVHDPGLTPETRTEEKEPTGSRKEALLPGA